MPVVPTLNGPSVRAAPIADGQARVRFTPDTFGAPIAAGIGDVGQVAQRVSLERERIRQDEQAKQRQVQLGTYTLERSAAKQRLLYDPKTGAMQAQGSKAFGVTTRTLEDYDKQVGEIAARIPDQKVREEFNRQTAEERLEMSQRLNIHEGNQYQRHDQTQFTATQENLRVQALRDAGDRKAVDQTVGRMEMGILEFGHRNGLPKEAIEQMRGQARSETHAAAIVALSDSGNYAGANQRFTEVKSALSPGDQAKLSKVLEIGTLRGESQRLADEIMRGNPDATIQDLLTVAADRAKDDPRLREVLEERLGKLHVVREQAVRESQGNAFDAAHRAMQDSPLGFDAIPPSALLRMSPQHVETLRSWDRKGGVVTTDRGVYYHLQQLAATPEGRATMLGEGNDPQTGKPFDLRIYMDRLSDGDWKEATKLVTNIREKATAPETAKQLAEIADLEDVTREALAPLGWSSTVGPKNPDSAQVIAFKDALRRRVTGMQATSGKSMTREQVRKEADALLIKQVTKHPRESIWERAGGLFDFSDSKNYETNRRAFEDPAVAQEAFTLSQIPTEYHDQLAQALNAEGFVYDRDRAAYDREMVRRYNLYLKQANAR